MTAKTYIIGLARLMNLLCKYIQRYETQLRRNMNDDQKAKLTTLLAACQALDAVLSLPSVQS